MEFLVFAVSPELGKVVVGIEIPFLGIVVIDSAASLGL